MTFPAGRRLLYNRRKGGELFIKIIAAAVRASVDGSGVGFFQKFAYLSAIGAFIFKNRHKAFLFKVLDSGLKNPIVYPLTRLKQGKDWDTGGNCSGMRWVGV